MAPLTEPRSLRLAMAQTNPTVGNLDGNKAKIIEFTREAARQGADIVVFPELALTGYPPEDLLLKPGFLRKVRSAITEIAANTKDIVSVVGYVEQQDDIYNAAAVISGGKIAGAHHKTHLPNYGVFDEDRYFQRGISPCVFSLGGVRFGVNVCEDIWFPDGPALVQSLVGEADLILVINASPYHRGKWFSRERMLAARAVDNASYICYTNMVGGQDELVFDGMSVILGPRGNVVSRAPAFQESLLVTDLDIVETARVRARDTRRRRNKANLLERKVTVDTIALDGNLIASSQSQDTVTPPLDELEEVYQALVLGTRDYVIKNGFKEVVIGLSGGIDSALTFAIACDALGPDKVLGVTMPSRFSSNDTKSDAQKVAENFGARFVTIPIEPVFESFLQALAPEFKDLPPSLAEENLQSRIRGTLLMGLSNKFGYLVLTTGNKSEMACGYATLYGDMAGGFAVLKDVPKTLVWELSRWRNRSGEFIPNSTIERPPSAELRDNQLDTDSLPPYEVLDQILLQYVEEDKSLQDIVLASGFDEALVRRVISMVDINEYKRRQAPPGVKITPKAFGKDRRLPITNAFRDV